MPIDAGKAIVTIGGSTAPLGKALRRAKAELDAFALQTAKVGAGLAAAAAPALAAMAASLKGFTDLDKFSKLADKTGESVEHLSALAYAAQQSAVPFEALATAALKLNQNLGSGKLSPDLEAALKGKGTADQFAIIAEAMAKMTDESEKTAAAVELFGRGGANILPMFTKGAEGLAAYAREAAQIGAVVSGEDAKNATALGDAYSKLATAAKAVSNAFAAIIAPPVTQLANDAADAAKGVIALVKDNKELIVTAAKVAVGVAAAGSAFLGVAAAAKALSVALGVVGTAGGLAVSVLGLLASPVVLVTAGVAGLGVALYNCSDAVRNLAAEAAPAIFAALGGAADDAAGAWNDAVNYIQERWAAMTSWATERLGAIWQALKAGQAQAAIDIAVASLQEAFYGVAEKVLTKWVDVRYAIAKAFVRVAADIYDRFASAWDGVVSLGLKAARAVVQAFQWIGGKITEALLGGVESLYDKVRGEGAFARDIGLTAKGGLTDTSTPWLDQQIAARDASAQSGKQKRAQALKDTLAGLDAAKAEDLASNDGWLAEVRKRKAAAEKAYRDAVAQIPEAAAPEGAKKNPYKAAAEGLDLTANRGRAGTGLGVIGGAGALQIFAGKTGTSAAEKTAKATEETAKATKKSAEDLAALREAAEANGGAIMLA